MTRRFKDWFWRLVLVEIALLAGYQTMGAEQPLPPLDGLMKYGCFIDHQNYWHVHGSADYADGHLQPKSQHGWIRLLSMREERKKAFRDCDEFMGQIAKAVKKSQSEQRK